MSMKNPKWFGSCSIILSLMWKKDTSAHLRLEYWGKGIYKNNGIILKIILGFFIFSYIYFFFIKKNIRKRDNV